MGYNIGVLIHEYNTVYTCLLFNYVVMYNFVWSCPAHYSYTLLDILYYHWISVFKVQGIWFLCTCVYSQIYLVGILLPFWIQWGVLYTHLRQCGSRGRGILSTSPSPYMRSSTWPQWEEPLVRELLYTCISHITTYNVMYFVPRQKLRLVYLMFFTGLYHNIMITTTWLYIVHCPIIKHFTMYTCTVLGLDTKIGNFKVRPS